MKLRTLFAGLIAGLMLTACGSGPSPKEVTEIFAKALVNGECEKALELAIDGAKESVEGAIEAGCDKSESKVESVECEVEEESATCVCHQSSDEAGQGEMMKTKYNYELEKTEEGWKVASYQKDFDMSGMGLGDGAFEDMEMPEEEGENHDGHDH